MKIILIHMKSSERARKIADAGKGTRNLGDKGTMAIARDTAEVLPLVEHPYSFYELMRQLVYKPPEDTTPHATGGEHEKIAFNNDPKSRSYGKAITPAQSRKFFEMVARVGGRAHWEVVEASGYGPIGVIGAMNGRELVCSIDCGVGLIEMRTPGSTSPDEKMAFLREYYATLTAAADELRIGIGGYGIQPFTSPSAKRLGQSPDPKYRRIEELLRDTSSRAVRERVLDAHHSMALIASTQVHVDTYYEERKEMSTVLTMIGPPLIALLANSSVREGRYSGYQAVRGLIQDELGLSGYFEGRTGISPRFKDDEQFYSKLFSYPFCITSRGNDYYALNKAITMEQFVREGSARATNLRTRKERVLRPNNEDMKALLGSMLLDNRKSYLPTSEFRPLDAQPTVKLDLAVDMMIAGIAQNLPEAYEWASQFSRRHAVRGREAAYTFEIGSDKSRMAGRPLAALAGEIIGLADAGLRASGRDPGVIDPIREIYDSGKTSAQLSRNVLEDKGMGAFLKHIRWR
jgi:gamma-glutamylcysteine synthetase